MRRLWMIATVIILIVAGCAESADSPQTLTTGSFETITGRDLRIVTGQTVYVPAYSEVFYGREGATIDLAVTLAIHNTDLDAPMIIQSVRYYDTDGALVKDYISDPIEIAPLATTGFLVESRDQSGGWGANFIVEWVAEEPIYEPVIEAIMVSSQGTHGISIISPGRVIADDR